MSHAPPVSLNVSDGVAVVRLNDGHSNGLSRDMVQALDRLLPEAGARTDVRVVILAGRTDHFSSGASMEVLRELAESRIAPEDLKLPRRVLEIPVPTIAAMEGHALGGGLALGLCCDIVMIARESRYGCPFMNYGFTPGMGTTRLLEHVASPAIAHEMLYTGQPVKGSRLAERSGFNYVLPRAELWPKAIDIAGRIAEKPREALVLLKDTLSLTRRKIYEEAFEREREMHRKTFSNPDVIARILEDSPPL